MTINTEQKLYVFTEGKYTSCLGFDVAYNQVKRLLYELRLDHQIEPRGSKELLEQRSYLLDKIRRMHEASGYRSQSELHPKLIGLEGKRIQCTMYGEKTRFIVGKSTGFIPIHLEIKTVRSSGGGGISCDADIDNIKIL